MSDFTTIFHKHLGISDHYQAPKVLMEILLDKPKREELFKNMLNDYDRNLDYDWFHEYFMDEHADRKKKKQDFTPKEMGELLSKLTGHNNNGNLILDVASGTGGLLIENWNHNRYKDGFFKYNPSNYLYHAEELSDRTLPFLLFNLSIRGMNATVFHGDVLSRKGYNIFFLENTKDSAIAFSNINVLPNSKAVEDYFRVEFVENIFPDEPKRKPLPIHNENGIEQLYYRLEQIGIDYKQEN